MSTNPDPAAFGAAIKARREDLQKNQMEVWADGGPSNSTLTTIENGRLTELTVATARKLDKGLDWPERTAWRLWRTGELELYGDPDPREERQLEPLPDLLEQLADRVEDLEARMDVMEALRASDKLTASHDERARDSVREVLAEADAKAADAPQSSPESQSADGA